ncbi:MAG: head-tail connector protein [Minisyncoccota bacterium]
MLDIEVAVAPTDVGTDIVSVASLKQRLRITHSKLDAVLEEAIIEAADKLHGPDGELRRSLFPMTYKRWLTRFPDLKNDRGGVVLVGKGVIPLPFPPLIGVVEIAIEDGTSPTTVVDPDTYAVRTGTIVGEIELKTDKEWPDYDEGPRAISITYEAGYTEYPPKLKRMVAILAAHNFLNPSATINDPRVLQINRQIEFGVADLRRALQVPLDYADWAE